MIITSADFDQNTKSAKTPRLKMPNSAPASPANPPAIVKAASS